LGNSTIVANDADVTASTRHYKLYISDTADKSAKQKKRSVYSGCDGISIWGNRQVGYFRQNRPGVVGLDGTNLRGEFIGSAGLIVFGKGSGCVEIGGIAALGQMARPVAFGLAVRELIAAFGFLGVGIEIDLFHGGGFAAIAAGVFLRLRVVNGGGGRGALRGHAKETGVKSDGKQALLLLVGEIDEFAKFANQRLSGGIAALGRLHAKLMLAIAEAHDLDESAGGFAGVPIGADLFVNLKMIAPQAQQRLAKPA
jgi:hypothetical protein